MKRKKKCPLCDTPADNEWDSLSSMESLKKQIIRLEEENKWLQGERDFDQSWNAELRGIIETLLTDNQKMRELLDGTLKESDDA